MIGLLLIYFIGRYFYHLAEDHQKSRWGFAILGVASYYVGTFVGGIIVAIIMELITPYSSDNIGDIGLSFMALPFGLLACWGLYSLLKRNWENKQRREEDIIQQIGEEESEQRP